MWLAFRARLSGDPGSKFVPTPLPPLVPYRPSRPGLQFALELELDYRTVATALSERLAGQTTDIRGQQARLDGISLSAKGGDLVLTAELSGDLAGQLTIMARPGFDTAAQIFRLEDVEFVFDSVDPDQELIANLFYERIRTRIETAANSLLAQRTKGLHDALTATLASGLRPNLAPDLSNLRIVELHFRVGDAGLTVQGAADGILKLGRSHSPWSL